MSPRSHSPSNSEDQSKSNWGWRAALNVITRGFTWLFRPLQKLWSVVSSPFSSSSSQKTQPLAPEKKENPESMRSSPVPVKTLSLSNASHRSSHLLSTDANSDITSAITHHKAIVRLSAEAKTESKGAYALYLLDNKNSIFSEEVKQLDGNAVLLYPGSINTSSSSSGSREEYKACFIQNGKVQYLPSPGTESRQLREISIGKRIISTSEIPHPNADNLIKAALARAGIVIAPILTAPKEVLPPSMDTQSLVSYARSSFLAHQLTRDQVNQRAVETLFMHISEGEISQVEKMLKANPELALLPWNSKTTIIQNKGGQRIYVQGKTAYEYAIGEEDTEIAALLKAAIIKVKGEVEGQEKANELFYKQRPLGWEEEETKRYAPTVAQAHRLAEAIRDGAADITSSGAPDYIVTVEEKSTTGYNLTVMSEKEFRQDGVIRPTLIMTPEGKYKLWGYKKESKQWELTLLDNFTLPPAWNNQKTVTISADLDIFETLNTGHTQSVASELAAYRKSLNDRRNEVVTTGRHYNLNLPQELHQIYDDHYVDYFGGHWDDPRAMLFWRQGIGGEQTGMTANMAQAYCDGLFNTAQKLQEGKPQGRSLKFEKYDSGGAAGGWAGADLYPRGRVDSDLGFKFALLGRWGRGAGRAWGRAGIVAVFPKLMSIKKSRLTETYSAPRPSRT